MSAPKILSSPQSLIAIDNLIRMIDNGVPLLLEKNLIQKITKNCLKNTRNQSRELQLNNLKDIEKMIKTVNSFTLQTQNDSIIIRQNRQKNQSVIKQNKTKERTNKHTAEIEFSTLKNPIKNIIQPFLNFLNNQLNEASLGKIIQKQRPTKLNPFKTKNKIAVNQGSPLLMKLKSQINSVFGVKTVWNRKLIIKIAQSQMLKKLSLYWLDNLADYWLFYFSKIFKQHKNPYRNAVSVIRSSIKNKKQPRFCKQDYSKMTLKDPQIPLQYQFAIKKSQNSGEQLPKIIQFILEEQQVLLPEQKVDSQNSMMLQEPLPTASEVQEALKKWQVYGQECEFESLQNSIRPFLDLRARGDEAMEDLFQENQFDPQGYNDFKF